MLGKHSTIEPHGHTQPSNRESLNAGTTNCTWQLSLNCAVLSKNILATQQMLISLSAPLPCLAAPLPTTGSTLRPDYHKGLSVWTVQIPVPEGHTGSGPPSTSYSGGWAHLLPLLRSLGSPVPQGVVANAEQLYNSVISLCGFLCWIKQKRMCFYPRKWMVPQSRARVKWTFIIKATQRRGT